MSEMIKRAKQVIVVRKDLTMSPEKMAAQVAHASLAVVLNLAEGTEGEDDFSKFTEYFFPVRHDTALHKWLSEKFTKIVVYATEEELTNAYDQAQKQGLLCSLIVDAGDSEFKGVKTLTCCAIGPAWSDEIDPITGKFPTRKK